MQSLPILWNNKLIRNTCFIEVNCLSMYINTCKISISTECFVDGRQHKKNIGILGGTFNPVHFGHLDIAIRAKNLFSLNTVALMPLGEPVHKADEYIAPAEERMEMVRLATQGSCLEAWDIEVARRGRTYTIDTLSALYRAIGDRCDLYYIIGADTLMALHKWKDIEEVFKLCTFLVFCRPGEDYEKVEYQARVFAEVCGAKIKLSSHSGPDISSTLIKQRILEGKGVRGLMPDAVCRYIKQKGLYGSILT